MWIVGIWPCSELLKKLRVSPICLIRTLSCFFFFFALTVCSLNLWGAMRKSSKFKKHAIQRVGDNVQQHTADILFWKIFVPAKISNSSEDLLQSCHCEEQRTFDVSVWGVRLTPLERCCLSSVLLWLVIGQFLRADWNQVSVQRPQYLKPLS